MCLEEIVFFSFVISSIFFLSFLFCSFFFRPCCFLFLHSFFPRFFLHSFPSLFPPLSLSRSIPSSFLSSIHSFLYSFPFPSSLLSFSLSFFLFSTLYLLHLFLISTLSSSVSLQHFSALSRDQLAGKLVNLCPSETPNDPYTDIIRVLETKRRQDASRGKREAIILEGFLGRDIVKKIVMRVGYGASRDSAIGYVEQWLQDMEHFPRKHIRRCSQYLGAGILECNNQLFQSANQLRK